MYYNNPIGYLDPLLDFVFQGLMYFVGFALIFLVIDTVLRIFGEPKEIDVMERWGVLLQDQAESGPEFLEFFERELEARDSQYEFSRRKNAWAGSELVAVRFSWVYQAFVSFGTTDGDLYITWVMWERPTWLYILPFVGRIFRRLFSTISISDRNRLLAFATFTKSCAENVVDSIMDKHDLDKTKIVRQSSGKLGPL